ncbi:MAG: hypothetical protein L0H25_10475, partial [Micrococcales bacterium]|nr:hypothetical protein [Micrococcales bacterium]
RQRQMCISDMALCAVRTLADREGEAALVRFYRAAAGGLAVSAEPMTDPEAIADDALRVTLGSSRSELESDVLARIAGLLTS